MYLNIRCTYIVRVFFFYFIIFRFGKRSPEFCWLSFIWFFLYFCNYKGNTPTTNIETVHKLNTWMRTDKKAKQPSRDRRHTTIRHRNRTENPLGNNNNKNKPEIQFSINFPCLRTHAGSQTHTQIHTHTHTESKLNKYVYICTLYLMKLNLHFVFFLYFEYVFKLLIL